MFIASAALHALFFSELAGRRCYMHTCTLQGERSIRGCSGCHYPHTLPAVAGHALTAVLPMLSNCNMTQLLQVSRAHREWSLNWSMELTGYCNYVEKFDEFEMNVTLSEKTSLKSQLLVSLMDRNSHWRLIWVIFLSELFSLGLQFQVL